jgi:hypothetical protein
MIEESVTIQVSPKLKDLSEMTGTLLISEECLTWSSSSFDIVIEYSSLVLYAISLEQGSIYCQVEGRMLDSLGIPVETLAQDEQDDDEIEGIEIWFRPEATEKLDQIYQIMTECSKLHPVQEPETIGTGDWITSENVDQFVPSAEEIQVLQQLEDKVTVNENGKRAGQFEDFER